MLASLKIEKEPISSQTQLLEELLRARGPGRRVFHTTDCGVAIGCWQRGIMFAAGGKGTTGQLSADRNDFFCTE